MGSVTESIKALFRSQPSIVDQMLAMQQPCRAGGGVVNRNIRIRIFDKNKLMSEMATPQDVAADLEAFLKGLPNTPGIEPAIAAGLTLYTFSVTYEESTPNQAQIDNFDHNDFPIYLRTVIPPFDSPTDDILKLLLAHRIPASSFFGRRPDPTVFETVPTELSYKSIEDSWTDKRTVLGFGIPGTYLDNRTHMRCRKIGIIKMRDFMTENIAPLNLRARIVAVIRHELGHMFGLPHEANTMMDERYDVNATFTHFTNNQLAVVQRALDLLTQ